ncbi:hypothetical protein ACLBOM_32035 [Escherichia coli]
MTEEVKRLIRSSLGNRAKEVWWSILFSKRTWMICRIKPASLTRFLPLLNANSNVKQKP